MINRPCYKADFLIVIRYFLKSPPYRSHHSITEMADFTEGNHVRVDLPDETDPDYDLYHGVHRTIVDVLEDNADALTGDA